MKDPERSPAPCRGLQCGDDCEEEYLDGTALELTATADDGSSFSGWSGACADASEDVCRLDVTEARHVTATFDLSTETPKSESSQPAPSGAEVQPPEIEAPGLPSLKPSPAPGPGRRPIRHRLRVTLDHARDVDGVARQSSGTVTSQPAGIRCEEYHFFTLTTQVGCTAGYPVGAQVTLTAEPGAVLDAIGNRTARTSVFAGWGGACAGEESTTCTVTMNAAKSATARFELPPPPLNLHVTVENQSRTDPTAGYLVRSQGSVTSQPAGISCEGTTLLNSATLPARCNELFQPGTDVTLTAEPARTQNAIGNSFTETSVFAGWGGACAGEESTTCTVTMDEATSVTAAFDLPPAPVNLNVEVLNQTRIDPTVGWAVRSQGRVTSQPAGISCEGITMLNSATLLARCNELFQPGTHVTLIAEPARVQSIIGNYFAETSVFAGWGGACAGEESTTCTVTMDEATFVTAEFELSPVPVDLDVDISNTTGWDPSLSQAVRSSGTVTSQPTGITCEQGSLLTLFTSMTDCTEAYVIGTEVTLTAEPGRVQNSWGGSTSDTSGFAGWGGACAGETSTTCTVTMDQARSVTAAFELTPQARLDVEVTHASGFNTDLGSASYGIQYSTGTVTSQPAGIDCEGLSVLNPFVSAAACHEVYPIGTHVTLTAEPGPVMNGWGAATTKTSGFAGWGGACAGEDNTCTVTMDEAASVTAEFDLSPAPQPLDVLVSNGYGWDPSISQTVRSSGTVTSQPAGIACEELNFSNIFTQAANCGEDYPIGTEVTLTAEPGPATSVLGTTSATSEFAGWGGACAGETSTTCTVTMDAARSVTARFTVAERPELTVTVTGEQERLRVGTSHATGSLSSAPAGITCRYAANRIGVIGQSGDCVEAYATGQRVTLTADPGPVRRGGGLTGGLTGQDSYVGEWGGACAGQEGTTCTVTVDEATAVSVEFLILD